MNRVFIDSETKTVISDLDRLYELEEMYFKRWFGSEYAYLNEEHHEEAYEDTQTLLDIQKQIEHFGGKPKTKGISSVRAREVNKNGKL